MKKKYKLKSAYQNDSFMRDLRKYENMEMIISAMTRTVFKDEKTFNYFIHELDKETEK